MSVVTELGYLGLNVGDLPAWKRFATEIAGMEWVDDGESDRCYLRVDSWHHRLTLHKSDEDDLAYVGWRVCDQAALEEVSERLTKNGIAVRSGSVAEADERRVMGLLKLASPGGIPTEIFWGPQVEAHKPFYPGRRMFGKFKTGDYGLGHIALREDDSSAAFRFYRLLGFKGNQQYKLQLPNGMIVRPYFMHCNDRQHTVQFDIGPMRRKINHLAIEYTELDDVGLARDIVRRRKIDIALDVGKHANDRAYSFYAANPSGWLWELAWGSRPAPAQDEYYTWDVFGHATGPGGYGIDFDTTTEI